jgi:hypothetical protein
MFLVPWFMAAYDDYTPKFLWVAFHQVCLPQGICPACVVVALGKHCGMLLCQLVAIFHGCDRSIVACCYASWLQSFMVVIEGTRSCGAFACWPTNPLRPGSWVFSLVGTDGQFLSIVLPSSSHGTQVLPFQSPCSSASGGGLNPLNL